MLEVKWAPKEAGSAAVKCRMPKDGLLSLGKARVPPVTKKFAPPRKLNAQPGVKTSVKAVQKCSEREVHQVEVRVASHDNAARRLAR